MCFLTREETVQITANRTTIYTRVAVDNHSQKGEPNRVPVSKDLINCPDKLTMHTANLTTTKIMWNSAISNVRFAIQLCQHQEFLPQNSSQLPRIHKKYTTQPCP